MLGDGMVSVTRSDSNPWRVGAPGSRSNAIRQHDWQQSDAQSWRTASPTSCATPLPIDPSDAASNRLSQRCIQRHLGASKVRSKPDRPLTYHRVSPKMNGRYLIGISTIRLLDLIGPTQLSLRHLSGITGMPSCHLVETSVVPRRDPWSICSITRSCLSEIFVVSS